MNAGAPRVVIIGGGFGGLYAARALADAPVRLTVVDQRNFHLFQPLLYQVATGGLSPGDIAAPIRAALRSQKNAEVLLAEVVDFDPAARKVILADGEVPYDWLIVAAGAVNSYFGHDAWQDAAPGLKTIEDATAIRGKLLYAFEAAEREPSVEARRQWLTFVVIGGGPTGVELSGAIGEIANKTLREEFRHIDPEESAILLVDAGPRLLQAYPEDLSRKAEQALIQLNVRSRLGLRVVGIDDTGVSLQRADGSTDRIAARTVFWAAGVRGAPVGAALAQRTGAAQDRGGRIPVGPDLTLPGHPEIFVIGDLAAVASDGKPVPGVAPAAMQMGRYAARQIAARTGGKTAPEPFRYHDKGSLAVIGRASAVADFGAVRLGGLIAWLAWLFIHLMYLVGFQNRVLVFVQWGFHYFSFNRNARLILGEKRLPALGGKRPESAPIPPR